MKHLFHVCITCHSETLFRDEEDIRCITNILALVGFSCQVEIWVDALMATHLHLVVFGEPDRVAQFAGRLKMRIAKYHRGRHGGSGPLFDPETFVLRLEGNNHILAAISYVLRNGMHHGGSATPFGYPDCSVNELFRSDLGKVPARKQVVSRAEIAACLPRYAEFPDHYAMDVNGMFLRSTFEELHRVELFYRTPRSFLYQMNRLSSEEWEQEQRRDEIPDAPVTLSSMEPRANARAMAEWLSNEKGYNYRHDRKTDLQVCQLIDSVCLSAFGKSSVYRLEDRQKRILADRLSREQHLPLAQLCRCLAL
jgi:REP element-mobilizing transposase RayT